MPDRIEPHNLRTFAELAPHAQANGYAVGAFNPRYPLMIAPVMRAAQTVQSPVLLQISQNDMNRFGVTVEEFAHTFFRFLEELGPAVPLGLHLDHTHDSTIIERALDAGFTSVMIDASAHDLEENIRLTREVADLAHSRGASVEGELGTIAATSFSEAEESEAAAFTDPEQVAEFVERSGVDALAVSVGTVHGVDASKTVTIDIERLREIRRRSDVHLVLHGGSGIPASQMHQAIELPGGGVSKVNLATDLELAMLAVLGSSERLPNRVIEGLEPSRLQLAQAAVERVARQKMTEVLLSAGRATGHPWSAAA